MFNISYFIDKMSKKIFIYFHICPNKMNGKIIFAEKLILVVMQLVDEEI